MHVKELLLKKILQLIHFFPSKNGFSDGQLFSFLSYVKFPPITDLEGFGCV